MLDLVPLIGFTVGGLLVAVVAALHDFPTALIIWAILFIVYQQLQDRVIQPIFYKSAVRIHPAVAVVVVLAGAQLAGILGALLAIPVAASLGAIFDELWPRARRRSGRRGPEPEGEGSGSGAGRRRRSRGRAGHAVALLGALEPVALAVEAPRPERVRLRQPDRGGDRRPARRSADCRAPTRTSPSPR